MQQQTVLLLRLVQFVVQSLIPQQVIPGQMQHVLHPKPALSAVQQKAKHSITISQYLLKKLTTHVQPVVMMFISVHAAMKQHIRIPQQQLTPPVQQQTVLLLRLVQFVVQSLIPQQVIPGQMQHVLHPKPALSAVQQKAKHSITISQYLLKKLTTHVQPVVMMFISVHAAMKQHIRIPQQQLTPSLR